MGMRDRPARCANCASRLCGALCGSGRPTRHSPPHGDIADDDDVAAAAAGRASLDAFCLNQSNGGLPIGTAMTARLVVRENRIHERPPRSAAT
jgi:hypothetical protein